MHMATLKEWYGCERKIGYVRERNANQHIRSMIKNKKARPGEMVAYECKAENGGCGMWHVGHARNQGHLRQLKTQ